MSGGVARGTPLEVIGYATGPGDPFPLDDRGVDRAVVARRAAHDDTIQAARAPRGFYCRLAR